MLKLDREYTLRRFPTQMVELGEDERKSCHTISTSPGRASPTDMAEVVERLFEERGGKIVTTVAEQLIQQGIELGQTKGRIEGRIEGRVETLLALLNHRFGDLSPTLGERLGRLGENQLQRMTLAALDANSLEEAMHRLAQIERIG